MSVRATFEIDTSKDVNECVTVWVWNTETRTHTAHAFNVGLNDTDVVNESTIKINGVVVGVDEIKGFWMVRAIKESRFNGEE